VSNVIEQVDGAVELLTDAGLCAAAWSFADLLVKWNRKHAQAVYVRYQRRSEKVMDGGNEITVYYYRYFSPALLGEGTDFNRYLSQVCAGNVFFDPGTKVEKASTAKSTVKARSQFRISVKNLNHLYKVFGPIAF
jgi:hypothetical protein